MTPGVHTPSALLEYNSRETLHSEHSRRLLQEVTWCLHKISYHNMHGTRSLTVSYYSHQKRHEPTERGFKYHSAQKKNWWIYILRPPSCLYRFHVSQWLGHLASHPARVRVPLKGAFCFCTLSMLYLCSMLYALCFIICIMLYALCIMLYALCFMLYALCLIN